MILESQLLLACNVRKHSSPQVLIMAGSSILESRLLTPTGIRLV